MNEVMSMVRYEIGETKPQSRSPKETESEENVTPDPHQVNHESLGL
jgi:hypothetical protein